MKKKLIRNLSILGVSVIVLVNLFVSLSSDTSKKSGVDLKLLTALASEYGHGSGSGSGSGWEPYEMCTFVCSDIKHFAHYCEVAGYASASCDWSAQYDCEVGHDNFRQSPTSVANARYWGCINAQGEESHDFRWSYDWIYQCFRCGLWYDKYNLLYR